MASAYDTKARAAGEAFVLLHQAVEDLTVLGAIPLARHRGFNPGPLLRMVVRSAIIALYRLHAIREQLLVPWVFNDTELRAMGFPPLDKFIDWPSFLTVRGQ